MLGAGVAGFLLWLAAQIGRGSTGGYWAAYGIVAGAGLVLALIAIAWPGRQSAGDVPSRVRAGVDRLRLGAARHAAAPELVPRPRAPLGRVTSACAIVVVDLGTWIGVMAFGIGYVFGTVLEPSWIGRRERGCRPRNVGTGLRPGRFRRAEQAAERAEIGPSVGDAD